MQSFNDFIGDLGIGQLVKLLRDHKIERVFHFAPLHYLPFIARARELKSKPALAAEGYSKTHFRSTSAHIDEARGFGDYVHLSTVANPPILSAKLRAGFPHIAVELKTEGLEEIPFDLCRFNIAKTRYLRRDGKPGFAESDANGSYYGIMQIPIARSFEEKERLLNSRLGDPMIEVLVEDRLPIQGNIRIEAYSRNDNDIVCEVLSALQVDWQAGLTAPQTPYERNQKYGADVKAFIAKALAEPDWRGNGLEFDRV